MWLQPLTQEDPTYHRTTKPSTTTMELQPLKPEPRSLCSTTGEATAGRAHTLQPERSPRSPQPERGGPLLPTARERSPRPPQPGREEPLLSTAIGEPPLSTAREKPMQQQRPAPAEINKHF